MSTIFVGDTYPFVVTLKIGTRIFPVSLTDTVSARWIETADAAAITAVASQVSTTGGADWPNGKVAIVFPAVEADKLAGRTQATLEVQVATAIGKQTFQVVYDVRSTNIP